MKEHVTDLPNGETLFYRTEAGDVRRMDITVSRIYLNAPGIDELNLIIVMWFDFAGEQACRKQIFMQRREFKEAFGEVGSTDELESAGKIFGQNEKPRNEQ